MTMKDECLKLVEASKDLLTYIDEAYVFDKASAGGCSGMDYHLSDTFYDLIVNTRKAINGIETSSADIDKKLHQEGCPGIFEAVKALITHIEKENAFDKVNDMGPIGIETYKSEAFIEVIRKTTKAITAVENG